jgi:hypothetical protein
MKDHPIVRSGGWITVAQSDCVVTRVYPEGSTSGVCQVVSDTRKPATHDVDWDGAAWFFPDRSVGGRTLDSSPFVQKLHRGRRDVWKRPSRPARTF